MYSSYNSPERGRKIGEGAGALEQTLMKMQMDERANAANLQFGQGGAVDRSNLATERNVALQYGPGGSVDRGFAQEDRRTNVLAPAYAGEGALAQAKASEQVQETGYNKIFSDKMINKMGGGAVADTNIAAPRPPIENKTGFMDIDSAMSESYNKWKPTGIGAIDWTARRARNLLFAPGRMLGQGAAGLATAGFWDK